MKSRFDVRSLFVRSAARRPRVFGRKRRDVLSESLESRMLLTGSEPGSIGDFVWHDLNANGQQDGGEPGLPGVTVTLSGTDSDGFPVDPMTQSTGPNGEYLFVDVFQGQYTVTFGTLPGYVRTVATTGDDATDSDANAGTGASGLIVLGNGENVLTIDAGLFQLASLGNFVWHDQNANGVQDGSEPGISGVVVTLAGPSGPQSTTTDASGLYQFSNLIPGNYTVTVSTPGGFVASPTGAGTSSTDSNGSPTTTILASGGTDQTLDFGYYQLASLGNFVWHDQNANGVQDGSEPGISGVVVTLAGPSGPQSTTTDANGLYQFSNLIPGTYTVTFGTLAGYVRTVANTGADASDSDAHAVTGVTGSYILSSGDNNLTVDAGYYLSAVRDITTGDTATIGFWQNKNGQKLIKSLNGSASSTALASWLAATFPNLYGANAGNYSMLKSNGTPLTNTEVAAKYVANFFKVTGQKTNAQVFAVALATYITSTQLSGGNYAAPFGFNTSAAGVGSFTVSVGTSGAAFGVPNHTVLSLNALLAYTNSQAVNGVLYNGNQTLINAANTVYDYINNHGDIKLTAAGSVGDIDQSVLVSGLKSLNVGTIYVGVGQLTGTNAAVEYDIILTAIQTLNVQLAPLSQHIELALISDMDAADIRINLAESTELGSVANGTLGYLDGNEITLITGWNWYVGADPSGITTDQFDFRTIITHELGHAIGLGHSRDTISVMYPELGGGQIRRSLSDGDLVLIDVADDDVGPEFLMASSFGGTQRPSSGDPGRMRGLSSRAHRTDSETSLFGTHSGKSRRVSNDIDSSHWSHARDLQSIHVSQSSPGKSSFRTSSLTAKGSRRVNVPNVIAEQTFADQSAGTFFPSLVDIDSVFANSETLFAE